jgi:hypothetical protein
MIFNNGWSSCPYCGGCFDTAGKCLKCGQYPPQEGVSLSSSTATQVKKIFDEAVQESINKAIGERDADIKQAWQNGYKKGKSDTVKEFAERVLKEINDAINHNTRIMESSSDTNLATYNNAIITNNACKGIYDAVSIIAKEFGVEVEK